MSWVHPSRLDKPIRSGGACSTPSSGKNVVRSCGANSNGGGTHGDTRGPAWLRKGEPEAALRLGGSAIERWSIAGVDIYGRRIDPAPMRRGNGMVLQQPKRPSIGEVNSAEPLLLPVQRGAGMQSLRDPVRSRSGCAWEEGSAEGSEHNRQPAEQSEHWRQNCSALRSSQTHQP